MTYELFPAADAAPAASETGIAAESEDPALRSQAVITVPHASGDEPGWIDPLGDDSVWHRHAKGSHYALDRGALSLALAMAAVLDATLVAAEWSRLFVDANRPLDDAEAIVATIEGVPLGFNTAISAGDLAARRFAHRRFHSRTEAAIAAARALGPVCLVDQHSFTRTGPDGNPRAVDIGICAPADTAFADTLLDALTARAQPRGRDERPDPFARRLNVRTDEPYSAAHPGAYVVRRHGPATSASVVIEVCDDLLAEAPAIAAIADLLGGCLAEAMHRHLVLEGEAA